MSAPSPAPPRGPGPDEVRRRFLAYTRERRDTATARALLHAEWRYLGPLLTATPRPRVLDLACGSGAHSLAWAERGADVVGIDFDHDLLVAGRERWQTRADGANPEPRSAAAGAALHPPQFACGDATRLPVAAEAFDVVFCNSLLEHVPAWEAVVAEIARVLRPAGVAIVYTTNRACPLQQEVNHFPFYSWLPDPLQRRTLAWIMAHHPDLVNFTAYPAVNWFTFGRMRRAFEAHGLAPLDRVDLAARSATGVKGALLRAMTAWPPLKWIYYVRTIAMALYGTRTRNTVPTSSGTS